MCHPDQLPCVKNISVDDNDCVQSCEGVFITGYDRRDFDEHTRKLILSKVKVEYGKYKADESLTFVGNDHFGGQFIVYV